MTTDPQLHWSVQPIRNHVGKGGFEQAWRVRARLQLDDAPLCRLGRWDRPLIITRAMEADSNQPTNAVIGSQMGKGFTTWTGLVAFLREAYRILTKKQYTDVLGDHVDELMKQLTDRVGGGPRIWLGPRELGDDALPQAAPLTAVDRAKGELITGDGPSY